MSEQIQSVRTLEVVEMEIRVIQNQGQRVLLSMAIETGRRLEEAKAMVGHGQWGDWLKKMGYSQSNANNLMRVFQEYGASQQSLFGGEANSQALGNLSLTKAIRPLALPDQEEREKFVEEHDVENMSVRELEKALKERDEALKEAAAVREDAKDIRREVRQLQEQMANQKRTYEAKLTSAGAEIERAETEAKAAEEARAQMEKDIEGRERFPEGPEGQGKVPGERGRQPARRAERSEVPPRGGSCGDPRTHGGGAGEADGRCGGEGPDR